LLKRTIMTMKSGKPDGGLEIDRREFPQFTTRCSKSQASGSGLSRSRTTTWVGL